MGRIYRAKNCKNHFKIEGKVIIFSLKMTWQLMWRNVRAAALNATLQLLVINRCNMCLGCIECFIYNLHWICILFDIYMRLYYIYIWIHPIRILYYIYIYITNMGLYANFIKDSSYCCLPWFIYLYILMLGLKYSFNEIYS